MNSKAKLNRKKTQEYLKTGDKYLAHFGLGDFMHFHIGFLISVKFRVFIVDTTYILKLYI